jgi:hypothetical protein
MFSLYLYSSATPPDSLSLFLSHLCFVGLKHTIVYS